MFNANNLFQLVTFGPIEKLDQLYRTPAVGITELEWWRLASFPCHTIFFASVLSSWNRDGKLCLSLFQLTPSVNRGRNEQHIATSSIILRISEATRVLTLGPLEALPQNRLCFLLRFVIYRYLWLSLILWQLAASIDQTDQFEIRAHFAGKSHWKSRECFASRYFSIWSWCSV